MLTLTVTIQPPTPTLVSLHHQLSELRFGDLVITKSYALLKLLSN